MTNTELFFALMGVIIVQIGNGWLQWWLAYMKKDGEYKSLKENLEGVITQQEEMKNDLEVLADAKKHLATERRLSVFEVYSRLDAYYVAISNAGWDIDNCLAESRQTDAVRNEYISADGKFHLLNEVGVEGQELQNKLIIAIMTYGKEVFTHTFSFAHKKENNISFQMEELTEPLNKIHLGKIDEVYPMLIDWREFLKTLL
jgi:hypothetical protein